MIEKLNLVLAGVGGQGTLVAGKLLGAVASQIGLDVKVSEVHGMSQRGGSVITYVRMSRQVFSPIVEPGTADFILAFEEVEALRWAHLLQHKGIMLVNTLRIVPMTVAMGKAVYPDNILGSLRDVAGERARVYAIDAAGLAADAGSSRAVNLVMIGAMAACLDVPAEQYHQAIDQVFAEKYRAVNQKAFDAGSAIMMERFNRA